MSASDHLQPLQFRHQEDETVHTLRAYVGRREVGKMHWYKQASTGTLEHAQGEIHMIKVDPVYQRQGIGRGMWDEAQQYSPAPVHSPFRSDEGDAWAQRVGGIVPPRRGL